VSLYIDKSKISYKPDTGTTMDQEWMKFITQHHVQDSAAEWKKTDPVLSDTKSALEGNLGGESQLCPPCDELFISTKTKVLFLNQGLNINDIFWKIPITEYWRPHSGVIKKQMKIVSKTPEEYEGYRSKLEGIPYYTESVIKQINNPTARRLKFKDERKITVGLSKKDIMNCRGKVKNAFYNCFAMILRFIHGGMFREIHVKIFNTGKMEIPGILNSEILDTVKTMILEILRANTSDPVGSVLVESKDSVVESKDSVVDPLGSVVDPLGSSVVESKEIDFIENENEDSVLINSNFNCGFYINRDTLYNILRGTKYNIEAAYDPCSYPGVKCKFYFNHDIGFNTEKQRGTIMQSDCLQKMSELGYNKKYTEVSFMIFRTGSCLIVGNCSESILRFIFEFIKTMLKEEFSEISVASEETVAKVKHNKIRKKTILISQEKYRSLNRLTNQSI